MTKERTFFSNCTPYAVRQYETTQDGATVVILDAQGGGGLELICRPEIVDTPARPLPANEVGVRHFSFAVENMAAVHSLLTSRGIVFTTEPRAPKIMKGAALIAFCKDPEGNLVEFIEKKPESIL